MLRAWPRWFSASLTCAVEIALLATVCDGGDPTEFTARRSEAASFESLIPQRDFYEDLFACEHEDRSQLLGELGSVRPHLKSNGVTCSLSSTQYYQGTAFGGKQTGFNYGAHDDCYVNINGEQAGLWQGLQIDLHGETRYGESANMLTGGFMAPNLLLAVPQPSGSVSALTNVKFRQTLSDHVVIFGGKLNTLDGSPQPLTGATSLDGFLNSSLIFNPIYTRTFPYSTFAAGFAYMQNSESIFGVAVMDTKDSATVSGFDTFFTNGASIYWQLNLPTQLWERPGHQGLSGTYSSGQYTSLEPTSYYDPSSGLTSITTSLETGSWSLAYNFDQAIWISPEDGRRVWGVFGNLGLADNDPSPIRCSGSLGLSGASPITTRQHDLFGVAYSYVGVSSTIKNALPTLLPLQNEHILEMYYHVAVTKWCHVTPDLQIIAPSLKTADTALVLGLRAKIDF